MVCVWGCGGVNLGMLMDAGLTNGDVGTPPIRPSFICMYVVNVRSPPHHLTSIPSRIYVRLPQPPLCTLCTAPPSHGISSCRRNSTPLTLSWVCSVAPPWHGENMTPHDVTHETPQLNQINQSIKSTNHTINSINQSINRSNHSFLLYYCWRHIRVF